MICVQCLFELLPLRKWLRLFMEKNSYMSSAILTFPSEGDYKLWSEKFALFNSEKAKAFLKESGQVNVSCVRITDETSVKVMIVWEYEDEEAFVRCQKLWSKWGDIAQDFVAKLVVYRGNKFYSW